MGEFVTHTECEERRNEVIGMVKENTTDIVDIKILLARIVANAESTSNNKKIELSIIIPILVAILSAVILRGI